MVARQPCALEIAAMQENVIVHVILAARGWWKRFGWGHGPPSASWFPSSPGALRFGEGGRQIHRGCDLDLPEHRDRIGELATRLYRWQERAGDEAPLPAL